MPKGATSVREQGIGTNKEQLAYRKIVKYPETALANDARNSLIRQGWKPCLSSEKGWQRYPEQQGGKAFLNYSKIEYFVKDTNILRLAFFYRLDQSRNEEVTDYKLPQSVSIERFTRVADSADDVRQSLKNQGFDCDR